MSLTTKEPQARPEQDDDRGLVVHLDSFTAPRSRSAELLDIAYGRAAIKDSLMRGEAPIAPHLTYGQNLVLDHSDPQQAHLINVAADMVLEIVDMLAVYVDRGISEAMQARIDYAGELGLTVERRSLPEWERGL